MKFWVRIIPTNSTGWGVTDQECWWTVNWTWHLPAMKANHVLEFMSNHIASKPRMWLFHSIQHMLCYTRSDSQLEYPMILQKSAVSSGLQSKQVLNTLHSQWTKKEHTPSNWSMISSSDWIDPATAPLALY